MNSNERIRNIRLETGMNRKDFAIYFGIPLRTIEDWEANRRTPPEYIPRMMLYQWRYEQMVKCKPTTSIGKNVESTRNVNIVVDTQGHKIVVIHDTIFRNKQNIAWCDVEKYLQHFDAVLLENHGALTFSDSLLAAYHKMESVEFYAKLLYISKQLGGAKELSESQVQRLYEIRRQFGLKGKHPADLCPNAKAGKPSCHSCGGNCTCGSHGSSAEEDIIAQITKNVLAQLKK